ncbi:DUF4188 domain-containing protein [Jatrophihabitans sp.]|uniref:DUF4188 domain-containing protein n=1 Tax=Jatrophihabitans sp. TaxID=1932789 RepID=UPI002EDE3486
MASIPIAESTTADHDADVVVFLIGMRINRWRSVQYWGPVVLAFLPMIRELLREPSSGCRSARTFFSGRTIMAVQYWDTVEQLISYAHDSQGKHRPAWKAFNRNATKSTAVGIFHETYSVRSGHYETIYRAMPPSGLAAATDSVAPLARRGMTARARLATGGRRPAHDRPATGGRTAAQDSQQADMPVGCPHSAGMPAAVPDSPAGLIAPYDRLAAALSG